MTSGGNSLNYFRGESTYQISCSLNSIKAKNCPLSRVFGGQARLSPNPRKLRLCCPHSMRSIRPGVTARCQSVRPSVCPVDRAQQRRAPGLLLSAPRPGAIDRTIRMCLPDAHHAICEVCPCQFVAVFNHAAVSVRTSCRFSPVL